MKTGPTDNKGTEEQGVQMKCSIQPLTVSIAMHVERSEAIVMYVKCVCWSGKMEVVVVGCYRKVCLKR